MSEYKLTHHQIIESALENFNADFFRKNNIIFGGGTRIALEIDEYRESIDIDFLCPDRDSYRAVRYETTNVSLGQLVKEPFEYPREILFDRYAVRPWIKYKGTPIKLEFVSCDNYLIGFEWNPALFPVPFLDKPSCFYTKLLANADRKLVEPYKDIFDLLAMRKAWGPIPNETIEAAEKHYQVVPSLIKSLEDILNDEEKYFYAAKQVKMKCDWAEDLIKNQAVTLLDEAKNYKQ
ncbi:nucleotidyl transferase AbiEii/AbiGii toxin family protein [Vibrio parahaemolyticus]|uniref:nucleotidyl transferase AbiEii/AbiGii toxin family protein n=1 Tax=Vibrio antiquarius (strain Ex25) TaxID=150340 RepID=UPI00265B4BBB|nr:nucleotidyl transferase AbiEii/AbiGii toxin family protein [Vibrio antiquarius]MCR9366960.1 nucleotidyl transferase AbiEii/AbiGii toxin family protein [Vibrio antiquarius]MCR9549128.1 nucleotidyl transferase AbiEii/AbiGii toxin family protein [Vibrio antiquarius]